VDNLTLFKQAVKLKNNHRLLEDYTMNKLRSQLALVCVCMLLGAANSALGVNPPANDDCSDAQPIGEVANLAFDTTNARFDGRAYCMVSPNLWYCYTPSCTGDVTVAVSGNFDTMLAVYNGCSCFPEDLIECNDDFGGSSNSQLTFAAVAGNHYLIEVGGYRLDTGQGLLTVSCSGTTPPPPPPPPSKDNCANAQAVGNVTNLAFDTRGMTFDGPGYCMTSPNIWYCYTASCSGNVTVSLLGSSYDTMLAVYNGCNCYPASSNLIDCDDDFNGSAQSQITFAATAGGQYLIEIGGYGSDTGQGVLTISCSSVPPSGNDCANALPVGDVNDLPFNTSGMSFDGPGYCMTSPNIWYCYTASCTGNATVSLLGSSYDTMLAVYNGCDCYPAAADLIECNDDFNGSQQSQITFAATAGAQYLIEIGGYGSETGHGRLSIHCEPTAIPQKTDLGDAPDSTNNFGAAMTAYPKGASTGTRAYYPTVFDDGRHVGPYGPVHVNAQLVAYLGKKITGEAEADIGYDEDGINNIEPLTNQPDNDGGDDGVIFPVNLPNGRWGTFDYLVNVVKPGTDLWVNVWCDWNRDGDWDDTLQSAAGPVPEWAVQNQLLFNLPAGLNRITTPAILSWHPTDGPKQMWMRITLSGQPWKGGSNPNVRGNGGSGPRTKYQIGETEDYYFTPNTSYTVCEDFNGDGVVNTQDLTDFTAAWLQNCPQ
jgi:GEVED domain